MYLPSWPHVFSSGSHYDKHICFVHHDHLHVAPVSIMTSTYVSYIMTNELRPWSQYDEHKYSSHNDQMYFARIVSTSWPSVPINPEIRKTRTLVPKYHNQGYQDKTRSLWHKAYAIASWHEDTVRQPRFDGHPPPDPERKKGHQTPNRLCYRCQAVPAPANTNSKPRFCL